MSKKRSDALQALIAEVVDLDSEITVASEAEEEARAEFVTARQALDTCRAKREAAEARRSATQKALAIIQERDQVADETVAALSDRAAR